MKFVVIYAESSDDSVATVGSQILAALAQHGFGGPIAPPSTAVAELPEAPRSSPREARPAKLAPRQEDQGESRSKYVDLIGQQLASGSKQAIDIATALKVTAAAFRLVLKKSPYFEQEDPDNRRSPWRLTKEGERKFQAGKA